MRPTALSALRGVLRLGAVLSIILGLFSVAPAQPALGDTASWSFNWLGQSPAAPAPWRPANWDVVVHSRDIDTLERLDPIDAQHGTDCSPPPATHTVTAYADAVFVCKEHMMTSINAQGYGAVYLTPDHMMDFTGAASRLTFSVSTLRESRRDWWDIWVTPWQENLVLPLQMNMPDLSGPPKDAIHLILMAEDRFTGEVYRNCVPNSCHDQELPVATQDSWDSRLPPSARTRTPFELDLSQGRIRFGIPSVNLWWIDGAIPGGLSWSKGVVQIGHHSYTPTKDVGCGQPACVANTWHWSDFSISRSEGFTMLRSDLIAAHEGSDTVHLPAPAPAGSFLRFAGLGKLRVGYDGAAPVAPQLQVQGGQTGEGVTDVGQYANYWTPVPAGTTTIRFSGEKWWGGPWWAQGIAVWNGRPSAIAESAGQAAPAPTLAPAQAALPSPRGDQLPAPSARPPAAARRSSQSPWLWHRWPWLRDTRLSAAVDAVPYGPVSVPLAALLVLAGLGAGAYAVVRRRRPRVKPPAS